MSVATTPLSPIPALVEPLALRRARQTFAYRLLAPLAVLAVLVWLVDGDALTALGALFAGCSAALLAAFPQSLSWDGISLRRWAVAAVLGVAAALAGGCADALTPLVLALMGCLLLRLVYLRQYYTKHAQLETAELMRRCLLIALWTHMSVFAALVSPY